MELQLASPAKVNLFLRIIKKRPDGYHALASLFQAVDLCDTLSLTLSDRDHLTCNIPDIPTDTSNLVLKAAALFRKKTGLNVFLKAHLEKRIPHQAGLGGGSSNAATTLWGLNQLCGRPVPLSDLIEWSGEIGSDITFFLSQGTAYCTGRGEIMTPIASLPRQALWLVKPKENLSTADVYRRYDATQVEQRNPDEYLHQFLTGTPSYFNDLEGPAFAAEPKLRGLREKLLQGGFQTVLMSGSGTAFFCIGEGRIPENEELSIFKVHFLTREKDGWYEAI